MEGAHRHKNSSTVLEYMTAIIQKHKYEVYYPDNIQKLIEKNSYMEFIKKNSFIPFNIIKSLEI